MHLRELAIDQVAARELRWYWGEADGEMGQHSNFEPMRARLEVGGRTGGRPITERDERELDAAGRERAVRRALEACSEQERLLLQTAFRDYRVFRDHRMPTLADVAREVAKGSLKDAEQMLGVFERAFTDTMPIAPDVPAAVSEWTASHTSRPRPAWLIRLAWRVHQGEQGRDVRVLHAVQAQARDQLRSALATFGTAWRAEKSRARRRQGAA